MLTHPYGIDLAVLRLLSREKLKALFFYKACICEFYNAMQVHIARS